MLRRPAPANGEDAVYAGDAGSSQHQLVDLAARCGHHHDHFRHAGDLSRDGIHQHRRWVGSLAARHVEAGAIQRGDLLTEHRAVGLGVGPGVLFLPLVIAAYALGGDLQGLALRWRDPLERLLQARARRIRSAMEATSRASKRWVSSTTAASPRSRTALMISRTRSFTPSSETLSQLSRWSDDGQSRHRQR